MSFFSKLFGAMPPEPPTPDPKTLIQIKALKRCCWVPTTSNLDGEPASSKFCGLPWLNAGEVWPQCPNCKQPLQLFLQLNSETLPEPAARPFGDGILQLFYCTNRDADCEQVHCGWDPFAKSVVGRIVEPDGRGQKTNFVAGQFPPRAIVSWAVADDFANVEDLAMRGVKIDSKFIGYVDKNFGPKIKDKLLGWPYWVQGADYPNCEHCKQKMSYVFQIDSEDNVPFMFGDGGCAHVFYCTCKRVVTIAWACF